jgi:hypothetical protein
VEGNRLIRVFMDQVFGPDLWYGATRLWGAGANCLPGKQIAGGDFGGLCCAR